MKKKLLVPVFIAGMVLSACGGAPKQTLDLTRMTFLAGETTDKTEYIKMGTALNAQMADEGFVLLKNDGTLPLAKGKKISICGKSSTNLARGGAGSGSGSVSSGVTSVDLQKSLTDAGFVINPKLTDFYKGNSSGSGRTNGNDGWKGNSEVTIGETPWSSYSQELINSFADYNDAAIQVITREGSEGCDVLTIDATDSTKFGYSEKHALELSDNEQALFDHLKESFQHIIFVINSSNIFECDKLMKDPKVAGILWIGNPGDVGPGAVGRILCGDVNPSGHTVDTWARDFTKDPTFQNFSDNRQFGEALPNTSNRLKHAAMDTMFNADGSPMRSYGTDKSYSNTSSPRWLEQNQKVVQGGINGVKPAAYISYEEGIYVDYRYYETRYADMAKENQTAADAWYAGEEGVVFPFGYGLSYTTFNQEIVRVNPANGAKLNKKTDVIEVSVKVTNTGNKAGKDVVQLYWKAPYTAGGIEKADHVLCAFDKSPMLQPNQSAYVNLKFHIQDVANYDFTDANKNGFKGYELDAGQYSILLNKNAHETFEDGVVNFTLGSTIKFETDRFTGHKVENRFTDRGFYSSMPGENDIEFTQMSRADFEGSFPTHPTIEDRKVKEGSRFEEFLTHEFVIEDADDEKHEYVPAAASKTAEDCEGWTQATSTMAKADRIQLIDMLDIDQDDPKWDEFLNQFTWAEFMKYIESNGMSSPSLNEIGKSGGSEGDGPQKFNIMWWVSSPIVAATWSQELARRQGECVGIESKVSGKSGWWGCAVNTHRSPFGGRNFEYYSADPFLMGRIAALVVEGATDRGVYAYFKHFAVNDQEKNRESGISFVNEQALREIYLKSFQMVFQEGKSIGVMGSYNRLGLMETAASYPLMTEVLRDEWGFKGAVLSDMTHSGNSSVNFKCYENVTNRCIAGCNSQLDMSGFRGQTTADLNWDAEMNAPVYVRDGQKIPSYTWWYAVRKAVKEVMYMYVRCTGTLGNSHYAPVVNETEMQVKLGEAIELAPDFGESYQNKAISEVAEYVANPRQVFPVGINFTEGKLNGKFNEIGTYVITIAGWVKLEDDSEKLLAHKFIFRVVPEEAANVVEEAA